ncbi:MAG: SDR family NAD(P)-dependent oxidoreductase [Arenicella sp.]|nr:SDR family NAD(P)-dependent oxidoreductase [Arenicella sp.]
MKSFIGKVCVITGAGSGIGRALAIKLAEQSALLELVDMNQTGLDKTVALLPAGTDANTHITDVADQSAMDDLASRISSQRKQVHVLINNAGVALGSSFRSTEMKDLEWIMGVNFWGVVYGCKSFLPLMQDEGEHSIVNVCSVFGLVSGPTLSGYSASKFAVRGFSEAIRQEALSEQGTIHVGCAFPAGIKTAIAKNARVYNPENDEEKAQQGRAEMEKSFVTTAEDAADDIISGIRKKQVRIRVGKGAWLIDMMSRFMPVTAASILFPKPKQKNAN